MEKYYIPGRVYARRSTPLPATAVEYGGVYIFCSAGTVTVHTTSLGTRDSWPLDADNESVLDITVLMGTEIEVTGTGTWNGYLRGTN